MLLLTALNGQFGLFGEIPNDKVDFTMTPTPDTTGISRRNVLTAAGTGLVASQLFGGTATAQDTKATFVTILSPRKAVPDDEKFQPYSEKNARGMGVFELVEGSVLRYTVMLANVEGLTGLHVHQGKAKENGPHLAELFNGEPTGRIDGVFLEHRLSKEDACTSDPPGDNCLNEGFEPLVEAMQTGNTYL